jgi:hypothetical protein
MTSGTAAGCKSIATWLVDSSVGSYDGGDAQESISFHGASRNPDRRVDGLA